MRRSRSLSAALAFCACAGLVTPIPLGARSQDPSEGRAAPAQEPAPAETTQETPPLEALAWMVGDWVDEGEGFRTEWSVSWSPNRAFLVRAFRTITDNPDEEPLRGTEVIGWDPADQTIRSWTFDSDGGFGEAVWTQNGDRWSARAKFTLPTGERASAVHLLTRIDENSYTWRSVSREVAGSPLPDVEEALVVRVQAQAKPEPEAAEPATDPESAPQRGDQRP